MATLRILHISDLHVRGDGTDRVTDWEFAEVLGDDWKANLDVIAADGVDLVCFTGDVAFAGQPCEYKRATKLVKELLRHLGLGLDRFFVVPGNHDIDRGINKGAWRKLRGLGHEDYPRLSKWMAGRQRDFGGLHAKNRGQVLARQQAYRDWVSRDLGRPELVPNHSGKSHQSLGWRVTLDTLPGLPPVHIVGLDTAWLAGDDADSGRLLLTEHQVMTHLTNTGASLSGLRLIMMHHPLGDLADGESLQPKLAKHADLVLRGHLHNPRVCASSLPRSELREVASGCLYEHRRFRKDAIDRWLERTPDIQSPPRGEEDT